MRAVPFGGKRTEDFSALKTGADLFGSAAQSGGSPDYGVGDRVKHIKFGVGTVEEIVKDTRDYQVTVNFDNFGVKKMFAAFAKLQKV